MGYHITALPERLQYVAELSDLKAKLNGGIGTVEITHPQDQQDLIDLWMEQTIRNW